MKKLLIILSLILIAGTCMSAPRKARRRLQLAASGAFSVLDIGGCKLWLDASDSPTVTTGATYTKWIDKSGNGNTFSNLVAVSPTVTNCSMNGLSGLCYNGTDQTLYGPNLGLHNSDITIFVVMRNEAVSAGFTYKLVFTLNRHNGGLWTGRYIQSNRQKMQIWNNSGFLNCDDYSMPNSGGDYMLEIEKDVGSYIKYYQNTSYIGLLSNYAAYTSGNTQLGYMEGLASIDYFDGQINEFIVYQKVLTTAERQQVETYLSDKWGL